MIKYKISIVFLFSNYLINMCEKNVPNYLKIFGCKKSYSMDAQFNFSG